MRLPDLSRSRDVRDLVRQALREDIGAGDVTTRALVPHDAMARAEVIAKESCVLSGGVVAERVFKEVDPALKVRRRAGEGTSLARGQVALELRGPAASILTAERVALNFIQRMSGIATLTRQFVERAGNAKVDILDTRKTTPLLRALEKYAVLCGGGSNHRFGLHDRVLIKDNHLAFWRGQRGGSFADAVRVARRKFPRLLIEIEVENEEELRDALEGKPDWILLDNMTPPQLRACVKICASRCRLEASGGVNLDTIRAIAKTGVDAVSVGALTHSARAMDFSLEFSK